MTGVTIVMIVTTVPAGGLAPGRGGSAALGRHPAVPRLAGQPQTQPRATAAELQLLHCPALHCPAMANNFF